MAKSINLKVGQRWEYQTPLDEFEPTLVIGEESNWGKKEYCIYIRYNSSAGGIPKNMDGVLLSLSQADLARNVVQLVESGVQLPEWWIYGRKPGKRPPSSSIRYECENINKTLQDILNLTRKETEGRKARAVAVSKAEVLRQLAPWREANKRPAWKPIVTKGDGELTSSKFSGIPWLGADESWPICSSCQNPLQLFVQLDLGDLPPELKNRFGKGLLQLFYCTHDCAAEKWAPFSQGKLVRVVKPTKRVKTPDVPIKKGYFPGKRISGWTAIDDYPGTQEHDELGLRIDFDFSKNVARVECQSLGLVFENQSMSIPEAISIAKNGDKLGGWPYWIQGAEYPDCPKCGARMEVVFQLDSNNNLPFMFGDVGCGHITQCPRDKDVVTFAWACS
jgi:uncharacterized protein YwqG